MKLYHEPELFRQMVKPSLPEWAAGWNEAGQSIKFVGALRMDDWEGSFASGLVHEVTHKMVSERTGDNAGTTATQGNDMSHALNRRRLLQLGLQVRKPDERLQLLRLRHERSHSRDGRHRLPGRHR